MLTPVLSLQNLEAVAPVVKKDEKKENEKPAFDLPPYISGLPGSFKSLLTEKQYKDMATFV